MRNDPQNPSGQKKPSQSTQGQQAQDRSRGQQSGQQAGQQKGQDDTSTQRTPGRQDRDDDTSRKH